jgi:proline iminopeptidase
VVAGPYPGIEPYDQGMLEVGDGHVSVRPDHRPDSRYDDPRFRMTIARLVTHYWRHAAFLEDGALLAGVTVAATDRFTRRR